MQKLKENTKLGSDAESLWQNGGDTRVTEGYVELLSNHWTRPQFLSKWHKAFRNLSKMKN